MVLTCPPLFNMECKQCHNLFSPNRKDQKYCGEKCQSLAKYYRIKSSPAYKKRNRERAAKYSTTPRGKQASKIKAQRLRFRLYGITNDDYNTMFQEQGGKCKICNRHQMEFNISLAIDHDHQTGKVRGLLCGKCNAALGLFDDNITRLKSAIEYLN